jgi:formate-nitrite transporter family protein
MKNLPLLIGTLVVTVLMVVGIVVMFSRSATAPQVVDQAQLVGESAHAMGDANAVVTIVEFSDFQCPACKATQPLLKEVVNLYPDKVRLVYRHFPLSSIHPHAEMAARASEVAAETGSFWPYHDLLFDRQLEWAELASADEVKQKFAGYAEELGIDKASFLERIESDHIKTLVTEDITAGGQLNVQSTPTLYVNGRQTPATQLLSVVESSINN